MGQQSQDNCFDKNIHSVFRFSSSWDLIYMPLEVYVWKNRGIPATSKGLLPSHFFPDCDAVCEHS